MELDEMIARMSLQAGRIRVLADGVSAEQARWRPDAGSWSLLEVINHLGDEEREDFRTRLDFILHRPGEDPPPIDPQGWVTARDYNQRDLAESIDRFLAERQTSLAWLRGLGSDRWTRPGSVVGICPPSKAWAKGRPTPCYFPPR